MSFLERVRGTLPPPAPLQRQAVVIVTTTQYLTPLSARISLCYIIIVKPMWEEWRGMKIGKKDAGLFRLWRMGC